jgi:uncharacterized surface protein with fasciclin (FAS1) repeats
MKALQTLLVLLSLGFLGTSAFAQEVTTPPPPPPMVAMDSSKAAVVRQPMDMSKGNVIDFASSSPYYTTFLAAAKAAEMEDSLKLKMPITVFLPSNIAFSKLPAGTVEGLLKPESKAALSNVMGYHVVAGNYPLQEILRAALRNKPARTTTLTTVTGGILTFALLETGKLTITDEKGGVSAISLSDMPATNGIIHITDGVLLPK